MGHYRSEMGYESEDAKERNRQEEKIKRFEAKLETMIAEKGLARTLAEMVAQARPGDGLCGWLG
jgi:hypothetical protein